MREEEIHDFLLYESVFPGTPISLYWSGLIVLMIVLLELGEPTRHHIVIYMRAQINSSQVRLQLDPNEVGAAAWINEK